MHDDPLDQGPGAKRPESPFDAVILWVMVALFGAIWVAMVWAGKAAGKAPGAMMTDKYSQVPTFTVTEPLASVLLGAGMAILLLGIGGGIRAAVVSANRGERKPVTGPKRLLCAKCGQESAGSFRFCPHCGAEL